MEDVCRRGQALLGLAYRLWRHEARAAGLVEAHESDEASLPWIDAHLHEPCPEGCGGRASLLVRH